MNVKNLFKNILLAITVTAVFFGALELAQRVRYYVRYGTKYYLTYGLKSKAPSEKSVDTYAEVPFVSFKTYHKCEPGTYQREYRGRKFPVRINSLGFRGQDFEIEKAGGVFRAVIVGGSSVQGLESPEEATIAGMLQGLLNEPGDPFLKGAGKTRAEVINAGFIAHTTTGMLDLVNSEILRFRPDVIVLYAAFNDYRNAGVFDNAGTFNNSAIKRILGNTFVWLYHHSLLFSSIYEKVTIFSKKAMPIGSAKQAFEDYRENLGDIIETAQNNGIRIVLVKQPLFIDGFPALQDENTQNEIEQKILKEEKISFEQAYYWMQSSLLDILEGLSDQYGITLVDPVKEMHKLNAEEALFHDIVHLTEEGNSYLAGEILKGLTEEYQARSK
ncbi:SGNH/GDSL hydrolase family protein [Candidatus Omnitrophota bacterium]